MTAKRVLRGSIAAACSVILVGAGAVLVAPVAANALSGINWKSAFKHEIQPRADKRYYTKAAARKRLAPQPKEIRGSFSVIGYTAIAGSNGGLSASINYGVTLTTAPTPHYIAFGDPVPSGCKGTLAEPGAKPGNLCVFERLNSNGNARDIFDTTTGFPGAQRFGAALYVTAKNAGQVAVYGAWALGVPAGGIAHGKVLAPRGASGPRTGAPVGR